MRVINKLEYIYRRAVGSMKFYKAILFKGKLKTLISFMLKKKRLMESMNMVAKHIKVCYVQEELDFLFITPKTY